MNLNKPRNRILVERQVEKHVVQVIAEELDIKEPIIQFPSTRHGTAYCASQRSSYSSSRVHQLAIVYDVSSPREFRHCSKLDTIRRNIDNDATNVNIRAGVTIPFCRRLIPEW